MAKYTVYGLPGVYNSTPLSLNDGDGVALAVTQQGQLIVVNADGTAVGTGIEYTSGAAIPGTIKAPSLVWSDGTNWQVVSTAKPLPVDTELKTADLDTGGGTDTEAVVGLLYGASGGGSLVTAANPLPTNITDGTSIANVLKSDGTFAGLNALMVGATGLTQAYSLSAAGTTTVLNVEGYASVSVDIISNLSGGAHQFQVSNDNTNWRFIRLATAQANDFASTPGSTGQIYAGSVMGAKYFRINITGTTGTAAGTIHLSSAPPNLPVSGYVSNNADAVGVNTNTAIFPVVNNNLIFNGTSYDRLRSVINATNSTGTGIVAAGLVAQLDDTSPTTITENQFGNLRIDTARQLRVNNQIAPDSTLLTPYSVRLAANATTTPTAATAYISCIIISAEVGGTTSTVTIQDKQGTPLKLVNGLTTVAATTGPTIYNFQRPVKMTGGIDIVTAGAVAATIDVWIDYYV